MSNLLNFFNGAGGGGSAPLRSLVPFPYDTPIKVTQGGMTFIRSGHGDPVDFDPSLQSWVDDNIMFVTTQFLESTEQNTLNRGVGVDTDGAGVWMAAGYMYNASFPLPSLYISTDDAVTWSAVPGLSLTNGQLVASVKSGGQGVWIVTVSNGSTGITMYRTTNNGQTWTNITSTAMGSSASNWRAIETNRQGVWLICFGNGATYLRRSADNGVTWTNVNYPTQNCYALKFGGGVWIAGTGDVQASGGYHPSIVVSTDLGLTWQAPITINFTDFAYVQNKWVAVYQSTIYHLVGSDFSKWNRVAPKFDDMFTDHQYSNFTWFLNAGLDGALWMTVGSWSFRSPDRGVTWMKIAPSTLPMSGPNKRAVATIIGAQWNGSIGGIITGRPAAGCVYSNDGRMINGYDNSRRYVMYMRIK